MIYMRKAGPKDLLSIMKIIEEARTFLADSGSDQWQNAYPAVFDIEEDFAKEQAYVLLVDDKIAGYCAIITGEEPAYTQITDCANRSNHRPVHPCLRGDHLLLGIAFPNRQQYHCTSWSTGKLCYGLHFHGCI